MGYRDGILPFCAKDPKTGEVSGALADYLTHADNSLKNADLAFESSAYPTSEAALDALMAGEVDCAFPVNLSSHDCEQMGILETNDLMRTEMFAVTRADERDVSADRAMTVALNEGNINYDTFLKDYFPNWEVRTYPDRDACLEAVASGERGWLARDKRRLVVWIRPFAVLCPNRPATWQCRTIVRRWCCRRTHR